MNNQNPIVAVVPVALDNGLYRLDVIVSNAPADLFGAAFHLKISGGDWMLEKYESGSAFALGEEKPLIIASPKIVNGVKEIIAGVSKTSQQRGKVVDGTLISFYVRNVGSGAVNLTFANTHLSVLDGGRRDVDGVVWRDGAIVSGRTAADSTAQRATGTEAKSEAGSLAGQVGGLASEQVEDSESVSAAGLALGQGDGLAAVFASSQLRADVFAKQDEFDAASLTQFYEFLSIALIIMVVGCVVCYFRVRGRRNCEKDSK
jgi:hypothetical protein